MDGRKYQRKSGIRRTLVMLLALVMLASVCFPAMRVSAEGTPDVTVEQGKSTTYAVENCGAATITVDPSDGKPEIKPSEDGNALTIDAAAASAGTYTVNLTWPSVEEGGEAITSSFVAKVTEPAPAERSEKAKEFDDKIANLTGQVNSFAGTLGEYTALEAEIGQLKEDINASLADTSVDVGSSDTELETITDSGTKSATETTTQPATKTTVEPTGEPTTSPTPEVVDKKGVSDNTAVFRGTDTNPAAIGGKDSITLKSGESATIESNVTGTSADSGHQESWKSDNEAVATVVYDLSDNKATLATVTGVSAGTATITHTYYTSKQVIFWTDWTKHNETIQVTVSATVTFNVGEDAATAGVVAPDSVTVTGGQTISNLPEPVWKTADGQFVKVFAGWYSDSEFTTPFTSDTQVNADTTLYAKWLDRYMVSFNVGDEATAAGVAAPASVTVTEGETVSSLPVPEWKDADGVVKVFAGWYSNETLETEFTETTPVMEATTLYAKWVAPDADGMYYVNFYSQDGQTVHLTMAVAEGKTVRPANGPTLEGKVFKGWSTQLQGESPASNLQAFDFNTLVSTAVGEGNTLNLYAWYANQVQVRFVSNGGMSVPTQILAEGDTATNVTPTREGYTFAGWYTNQELTEVFDFNTLVNADITLYAKWTANMVPVTLVYMYENADDAEYSPAGDSETVYAPAGSYLSIEKSNITAIGQTHAVRYSETADGNLTGNAKTTQTGNTDATIQDVRDTYFQYETATNNRQVMPDGSTVVMLYYNRARITLTFTYNLSSNASMDVNTLISAEDQAKYNVVYTPTTSGGYKRFTYSFTAKYRENIVPVWARTGWVTNDSSGRNTFYTWKCPDEHMQTSNMYTLEDTLFKTKNGSGLSISSDGKLVGSGALVSYATRVQEDWLIYARTTLPGETVDFTYGGKNYTIYTEACQVGYTGSTFGYKALDGCTPYSGEPELTARYGTSMSISNLTVNGTLKEKYDTVFSKEVADGTLTTDDLCQVLLYDRNTVKLSVWTNDDAHPAGSKEQTNDYLYGDWIYNEDTDWLKTLEAAMAKEGYIFAGWFTDPNFTPGTEYTLNENSRIYGNLNLYAKWEPNQFLAEYYLYMDDASPYATQGFAEGGKIDNKFVPVAVQSSFLGWYWYDESGQLVPFDFTSTVGRAHVDSNDKLKLYAKWQGTTGKVSYLPGIGGNNATQEVTDPRDFAINDAAVQLRQPSTVWIDGSVPNSQNLTFVGWKAPNGKIYQPGRYVLVTRQLMQFEAQWSNDAVTLIYNANGGNGADVTETWARNSVVDIWDNMDANTPHFTRDGYELIGWDENPNATTPTYLLGQGSITLNQDVTTLYAIWKLNTVELTIQKTVSGNMYNANDVFSFTLNYGESPETFTLKVGESKTFQVPVGAEVTVTEDLSTSNGYIPSNGTGTTVKLTGTLGKDGIFKFTMPEQNSKLVINNDKTVQIDTGIVTDSLPYILLLTMAVIGAGVLLLKKRRVF